MHSVGRVVPQDYLFADKMFSFVKIAGHRSEVTNEIEIVFARYIIMHLTNDEYQPRSPSDFEKRNHKDRSHERNVKYRIAQPNCHKLHCRIITTC